MLSSMMMQHKLNSYNSCYSVMFDEQAHLATSDSLTMAGLMS